MEPASEFVSLKGLARAEDRLVDEVLGFKARFAGKGTVLAREDPPDVLRAQADRGVVRHIGRAHKDAEVRESGVELRLHGGLRAAHHDAAHLRRRILQALHRPGKSPQCRRLGRGNPNFARKLVLFEHFALGAVAEIHDRTRTLEKELALGRQAQPAVRAHKKLVPELCLELHELARERRLRQMEALGGARNAFRFDGGNEIAKYADVHNELLRCGISMLMKHGNWKNKSI